MGLLEAPFLLVMLATLVNSSSIKIKIYTYVMDLKITDVNKLIFLTKFIEIYGFSDYIETNIFVLLCILNYIIFR